MVFTKILAATRLGERLPIHQSQYHSPQPPKVEMMGRVQIQKEPISDLMRTNYLFWFQRRDNTILYSCLSIQGMKPFQGKKLFLTAHCFN
jgi:hypothetical protein